jgi:internalin A
LKNTKGELRYSDLPGILPKKDYPEDKYNFLLDLMRKFELCFEFHDEGEGRRFLVPELLDIQKPELGDEFAPEKCLNFRYEYKILPEGLLPRFIVRTYPMSENRARWKTGVVLEWEECKALIEADKAERQVIIRVNRTKECRRRLLAVIRSNFDHIHFEVKEFKPEEWIAPEEHPLEGKKSL